MTLPKFIAFSLLIISFQYGFATPSVLTQNLYSEEAWEAVSVAEDGIIIEEKIIPGISVKAVRVSKIMAIDPHILAEVVEDVTNYKSFLTSAPGMVCDLLEVNDDGLIAYQYVDVPLISDRVYGFKMYRPDSAGTRVDWQLLPKDELGDFQINDRSAVYIDYGVGSWSMKALDDGTYEVSYRLIMDPGGWIPDRMSDYFNKVSITGIFRDAIIETQRRSLTERG
ncbi:MAG: hypothetical protein K9N35_12200 [Candidatus Marinimicrobia bacterium]|nr:hypothetical protein [Candidatus Neomarinimicrobiota bacterium]